MTSMGEELYSEEYRPQLHYSPPIGWMNDPNGLVFYKDTYHMFYQHWPNGTKLGPIHWGHATSKDLIHWQTLPIALYPQGNEYIFSGSALIDHQNVSMLQTNSDNEPMIAIFTAHTNPDFIEKQWMAYSNDQGVNWNFYEGNPIIPQIENQKDFRDPHAFKYGDHFVMVVVAKDHIQVFNSDDLINWTLVSRFGQNDGSHIGVWECPSLFPMNVTINGVQTEKWVLIISLDSSYGLSTGAYMQYFIGSFDGKTFINENSNDTVLWIDYGPDSYAGVTFNELEERRVFINWMNRWDYAQDLPLNPWNGQMGIPRELKLVEVEQGEILLSSLPVPELKNISTPLLTWSEEGPVKANFTKCINSETEITSNLLDIELSADISQLSASDRLGVKFSGGEDELIVYFNGSYVIDRTNAGRHDFSDKYGLVYTAPRLASSPLMKLRLILDVSSIELFADNGLTSMTSLFFSDNSLTSNITLFFESNNDNSELKNINLVINQLKSIWK